MTTYDALQKVRTPAVQMQQPQMPKQAFGLPDAPPLLYGGKMYPPNHPLYQLIKGVLMQQYINKGPQQGSAG